VFAFPYKPNRISFIVCGVRYSLPRFIYEPGLE
jgi:hypothetical protein